MGAITPNPAYWARYRERALALGSDGCTKVNEWNRDCCYRHDVHWRTGMDINGHPISKAQANVLFWECNRQRSRSRLSYYDPRSLVRFVGVQLGAWWSKRKGEKL